METRHSFVAYSFKGVFNRADIDINPVLNRTRTDPQNAIYRDLKDGKGVFAYAFGALTFWNVPAEERRKEIDYFVTHWNVEFGDRTEAEEFIVIEEPGLKPRVEFNRLMLDMLTTERAEVVALTLAQSVSMERYEGVVKLMWGKVNLLVDDLQRKGRIPFRPGKFHRFIADTISARNSIVGVLHLLDRPDLIWDDATMDTLYPDLRATFDLLERFQAISYKLETTQDTLELLLDTTRDKRLFWTEVAIVVLILIEVILGLYDRGWLGI